MALDRQSIEKRDFPIGRRGYDPDAVDAHLAALADEIDALKRSAGRQRGDTLASAASEQVRLIVEAAEQSAADIEREADLEARRIRQEAREASEKMRTEAGTQARDHVQQVQEGASAMLERIDAMESELRGLIEGLRSGANRVTADLALLQGAVGDLRSSTSGGGSSSLETGSRARATVPAASSGASSEPAVAEPEPAPVDDAPTAAEDTDVDDAPAAIEDDTASDKPADEEGARLIALNMALNGTPREETEAYLSDNFALEDTQGLLDDVYARAGQ